MNKFVWLLGIFIVFPIAMSYAIEVGDKLPENAKDAGTMVLVNSAQFYPAYIVVENNIEFTVTAPNGTISYIAIDKPNFKTPEGVSVGDDFKKVLMVSKKPSVKEPGWAWYIPLPSGWNAAFVVGTSMTEGEIKNDSKVMWLFRRADIK